MEMSRHSENKAVDLVKLVMAIWIMISHTTCNSMASRCLFGETNQIAVLIFFSITGYYLADRGVVGSPDLGKKYISELLQLFTLWMIIQWVWDVIVNIGNDYDFWDHLRFYLNGLFTLNGYMQLWYLGAIIVCVSILCVMRLDTPPLFLIICLGVFFVVHRTDYLEAVIGLLWGEYVFSKQSQCQQHGSRLLKMLGVVALYVALIYYCRFILAINPNVQSLCLNDDAAGIIVRVLILVIAMIGSWLTLTCSNVVSDSNNTKFWYTCRKMSTLIFLLHYQMGISIVLFVRNRINLGEMSMVQLDIISALINGVVCFSSAIVLMVLSKRYTFLKKLY